ncbi:MAG TPA: hypothetical protein DDZ66_01520 [Firmicutes bacterium]|nr:hypothetical protein [Bacillota bacterium]
MGMLLGWFLGISTCLLALNAHLLWRNQRGKRNTELSQNIRTQKSKERALVKKGTVPLPNGSAMTSSSITSSRKGE